MFQTPKYKKPAVWFSATFIFSLVLGLSTSLAQAQASFNHLSVNDGLSQSTIYAITQDSKGFLWFGTRGGGLNRYDGYDFHVYKNNPEIPTSLSDDEVISILEDSHGNLWIGTRNGGLNRYDLATGGFTHYFRKASSEMEEDNRETALAVRTIHEDHQGRIWIGMNHQVCLYNPESDQFDPILEDAGVQVRAASGICEDSFGNLYFATWDRLIKYDPEQGTAAQLLYPEDPYTEFGGRIAPVLIDRNDRLWIGTPDGLKIVEISKAFEFIEDKSPWPVSFSYIRAITETRNGLVWFGTGDGLYSYDSETGKLSEFKTELNNPESLGHNSIYSIFEDRVGTLWIGTWSGISILDNRKYEFAHYAHMYNDPRSLSNNIVSSFQEERDGTWIGTEQGGLNFMNKSRSDFTAYKHEENNPNSLPSNNVKTIFLDSGNNLWVGTFKGGLSLFDRSRGAFTNFLEDNSVFDMAEMPTGTLWIGSISGLYFMELKSGKISRDMPHLGSQLQESFVTVLFKDSAGRMWIGTKDDGLYRFDAVRAQFMHYQFSESDTISLSSDYVISICEDPDQRIWIGTNSGLNLFDEPSGGFEKYDQNIGIEDNVINGLLADDHGNIWISTNGGLYQYNYRTHELNHYDYLDGLQSNEFNRGAYFKSASGEMFFGGVAGFNAFFPQDIRKNPDAPPVIITDLKLFNKSVMPGEKNSPLVRHISETSQIVLTHRQSSFSFDFVALNYLIPEKNNYDYMLEGYETQWNHSGRVRTASYMNLDPGNYTFRVRGSNNNNVWNEEGASIDIIIKGPYWKSPLAILLYFLSLIGLLVTLIRFVRFRAEKENELKLERAEKDSMRELNQMRLQFFTNVSHEFRTPLTLMSGPLDKLMSGRYEHQKAYLFTLMKSNVDRMLRLVNQLMDFRKLDNDKMPLHIRRGNLDELISQIVLGFEDLASRKMIELRYDADLGMVESNEQWFDEGIIDKVTYNLLSNAFKFTPEHGIIQVRLTLEGATARLIVQDTGRGIDKEKVNRIFERFYSENTPQHTGTGIGLSLSKRLIDLHKGGIEVTSENGKGATFTVTIPVGKESYLPDEIISDPEKHVISRPGLDPVTGLSFAESTGIQTETTGQTILIAEDNEELSSYLADHFSGYHPVICENGKEALEKILEKIPDLVISDIMMPEMDGLELCRKIKENFITSHIPVVLLTAKSAVDQKIQGMETGADAYVEKPFDADYLTAVVKNLLAQRKKLREKYAGQAGSILDNAEVNGADRTFLEHVERVIQEHISDPEFTVDQLLGEVHMSRSQLYRKFSAITDKNPSEYIRILRLNHATRLLRKNQYTISEIAFMSGFGNVSYFITCFKKHFGTSPGKFIESEIPS